MATAIALIQQEGVNLALPSVNESMFGFRPDTTNNQIIFGLKGINGINTEVSQLIIQNRPYASIEDFAEKLLDNKLIKPSQMVQLIKAGCFTEIHNLDRMVTMDWYLRKYLFIPCEKLGMQQFEKLKELKIIPDELDLCIRMVHFKKYVLDDVALIEKHIDETKKKIPKRGYHDGYYILDQKAQEFFQKHFTEESVVDVKDGFYVVSEKKFTKEADKYIQPLKDWMSDPETLQKYNKALYQTVWDKYAEGTLPFWSMSSLCYYDGEHELANIDEEKYGIVNYFELPEQPEPYAYYTRYVNGQPKAMPKYKISRIAGTVLNADNNHHTVSLLTCYGVVNVKFNKGHYAFYNKRISAKLDPNSDKKTVLENSWLKRGNKIAVAGIRRDDQFWPMVYKDTIYKHTVNLIREIHDDGTLLLQAERTKV